MSSEAGLARLANAIAAEARQQGASTPEIRGAEWRLGIITAVNADGTIDVGEIRARCLDGYAAPAVGDQVAILRSGSGNWLALDRTATAAAGMGVEIEVAQGSNQTVTNSATLVDSDITFPVLPGARYRFLLLGSFRASAGSSGGRGIRGAWTVPANASMSRWITGPGVNNTSTDPSALTQVAMIVPLAASTVSTVGGAGTGSSSIYREEGVLTGGDGGDVTFQFAQHVAATSTSVELRAFTRFYYWRIS